MTYPQKLEFRKKAIRMTIRYSLLIAVLAGTGIAMRWIIADYLLKKADRLFTGENVRRNYELSFDYYKRAAGLGNGVAMRKVANFYDAGLLVPQDFTVAFQWYKDAAQSGDTEAQFCLGNCYYNGDGVDKNEALARLWFKKAAKRGHAKALECLSLMDAAAPPKN